jgi:uncharacterized protein (DUF58 family)
MNSKGLTLVLVIFGLLVAALVSRDGDLALLALPFLAYLWVGVLRSPAAEKIHLEAWRSVEKSITPGLPSVEVRVTVRNQGAALDCLRLADPLLAGMSVTGGFLQRLAALSSGEQAALQYTFQAGRGYFSWSSIQAVASDPFGLFETRLELPSAAEVQVQPVLEKYRPFRLRPQRTLHSAGSIPARLGGSGTDFWGVREYHPGDALRRLDWRLAARHPRQLFTREFEQEEIADIGLLLDARQKIELRVDGDSLFEHSVRAAASLAEVFLRQGNRVSLFIYGEPQTILLPGYGKVQLNRILRALSGAALKPDGSLDSLQYLPVQMFSSRSLILVISPLAPNDWRLFPRLRAYGYQVLLVSPDPFDFAQRLFTADPTTRLASSFARLERRLEIGKITHLWIPVIDWQVGQPLAPLVRSALSRPGIQRER